MGQRHIVQETGGDHPRVFEALYKRLDKLSLGVGDDEEPANKKTESEIDPDTIEPNFRMGIRPADELTQLFHGTALG